MRTNRRGRFTRHPFRRFDKVALAVGATIVIYKGSLALLPRRHLIEELPPIYLLFARLRTVKKPSKRLSSKEGGFYVCCYSNTYFIYNERADNNAPIRLYS